VIHKANIATVLGAVIRVVEKRGTAIRAFEAKGRGSRKAEKGRGSMTYIQSSIRPIHAPGNDFSVTHKYATDRRLIGSKSQFCLKKQTCQ